MSHEKPSGDIYHAADPHAAALSFAKRDDLPLGARVQVRDMDDRPQTFVVARSSRSAGMLDGGAVEVRRAAPPLRGGGLRGGGGEARDDDSDDHIMHARTKAQAALLYAKEAGLPPGSYVRVEHPADGKGGVFFRTPQ